MNAAFLFVFLAAQLLIGLLLARRMKTESDYFLGGRNVGLLFASFSLFATWFGAETCIGSSGQVYASGLSGSRADPFGFTLCLVLLGLLIAVPLRKGGYVTLADYFRERFGPAVEQISVWVMIPSSLIWGAAQLRAFGQIFATVAGFPVVPVIVFSAVFVVLYTYLGGLLSDIYTDFLQGLIVVGGLIGLLILVIIKVPDLKAILAGIEPSRWSFIAPGEPLLTRFDRWLVPILGSLVTQETLARVLATRTPSLARKACYVAAGLYLFVGAIPVFAGLIGPHLLPGIADREQFLILLAGKILPRALFVLFAGALISAILSTMDSILLAVSALFTHNLIFPLLHIDSERLRVLIARLGVAAAGGLACLIAVTGGGIYALVLTAASFGTAGVLVITLLGLHTPAGGRAAGVATLVTGLAATLIGQYVFRLQAPFLAAVLASAAVFLGTSAWEHARGAVPVRAGTRPPLQRAPEPSEAVRKE